MGPAKGVGSLPLPGTDFAAQHEQQAADLGICPGIRLVRARRPAGRACRSKLLIRDYPGSSGTRGIGDCRAHRCPKPRPTPGRSAPGRTFRRDARDARQPGPRNPARETLARTPAACSPGPKSASSWSSCAQPGRLSTARLTAPATTTRIARRTIVFYSPPHANGRAAHFTSGCRRLAEMRAAQSSSRLQLDSFQQAPGECRFRTARTWRARVPPGSWRRAVAPSRGVVSR